MPKRLKWLLIFSLFVLEFATPASAQVPAPTPAPTPTAQGTLAPDGSYTVRRGDTLYGISARFGLTIARLTSANGLGAAPLLAVGQVLLIPGGEAVAPAGASGAVIAGRQGAAATHRVRAGDTFYSIARLYGIDIAALSAANDLIDPSRLRVGQVLTLPTAVQTAAAGTSPAAVPDSYHHVTAGQTLYAIAQLYGVQLSALAAANNISDPSQLAVGQRLRLPSASGAAPSRPIGAASPGAGGLQPQAQDVYLDPVTQESLGGAPIATTSPTLTDPAQIEVAVAPGVQTPLMLPPPPPRRGTKFHWPARGKILTRFGRQSNGQTFDGIVIKVAPGASVLAAEDGVVAFAGMGVSGQGYLVLLKHADDYYTAYGENSAVTVARGDRVQRGQLIARAGTRVLGLEGRLHFEVRYREDPVNPIAYMVN